MNWDPKVCTWCGNEVRTTKPNLNDPNTYVNIITKTNNNITSNNNHNNSGNEIYNVIKGDINITKDNKNSETNTKQKGHI